jgi:hypothetical protein
MFPGHPWEGEEFGPIEYQWYLARGYCFNVEFDVDLHPFLDFCKRNRHQPHELTMKIAARLSAAHLPQRTMALNRRSYPARYPAGFVRPVAEGHDMLEHVAVREKADLFTERVIRDQMQPMVRWFQTRLPRTAIWLARHFFSSREIKDNYALMVTRNPLRNLGTRVVFHGTHYRTFLLCIPFGEQVTVTFGAPHALGNINYYEPFLLKFKTYMEDPTQIPRDLLEKAYRAAPRKNGGPPQSLG